MVRDAFWDASSIHQWKVVRATPLTQSALKAAFANRVSSDIAENASNPLSARQKVAKV